MAEIFLSYRRSDDPAATKLLQERLTSTFGDRAIFYDVETIPQGEDFVSFIDRTIRECKVVLVMIGPRWLDAGDARGRRLDQPNDAVRTEIETALRLRKKVIPVLVNDTPMPNEDDLPVTIAALHRQNAAPLHTNQYFRPDMDRLIATLAQAGVGPTFPTVGSQAGGGRGGISGRWLAGLLSIPLVIFLVGVLVLGGIGIVFFSQLQSLFNSFGGQPTVTVNPNVTLAPPIGQLQCTDKQYQVKLTNDDDRAYQYRVELSNDPAGQPWATLRESTTGTVAKHSSHTFTLVPASTLCDDLGGQPRSLTVTVTCTPVGSSIPLSPLTTDLTVTPPFPQP